MSSSNPQRKRTWPYFAVIGVVAAIGLSIAWVSKEARRVAQERDAMQSFKEAQASGTNAPLTSADSSWTNDMVWIPAGTFWMGSESGQSDEKPVHKVSLSGYWIDKTEVTNDQFEKFVKATGYVTLAERKPKPEDFPGADPELLVPGSIVFTPPAQAVSLEDHMQW